MNVKNLIFTLILLVSAPLSAMNLGPGTVIEPLKHNGQFTVSMTQTSFAALPSGLPATVSQASKMGSDLFKNKGIPVLITSAAGMVPWWALTTGTGYLIISQCGISDPTLFATVVAGASYATGEHSNSVINKYINNPYVKNIAQAALCASCFGLSYASSNPIISEALSATAQAIGLQTLIQTSCQLLAHAKPNAPQNQPPTSPAWYTLSPETKANLIDGTTHALSTILPSLCATNVCDPHAMLRILLYEQAYRLAQNGCAAAQHLVNK